MPMFKAIFDAPKQRLPEPDWKDFKDGGRGKEIVVAHVARTSDKLAITADMAVFAVSSRGLFLDAGYVWVWDHGEFVRSGVRIRARPPWRRSRHDILVQAFESAGISFRHSHGAPFDDTLPTDHRVLAKTVAQAIANKGETVIANRLGMDFHW